MKILDTINNYRKETVYDYYTRIIPNFKNYDKVTKKQMVTAIYKFYQDYNNIIEICTTKELKYLTLMLKKDKSYMDEKYNWERTTLRSKFILVYNFDERKYYIPEEIENNVNIALKNVKWNDAKKNDEINEILVGYCKLKGIVDLESLLDLAENLTGINKKYLLKNIQYNKLFKFYVYNDVIDNNKNIKSIELIFQDYYYLKDELRIQIKNQSVAGTLQISTNKLKYLFYNSFNLKNEKVKKFFDELDKLPCFTTEIVKEFHEISILNGNRKKLKEDIQSIPILENYNLNTFFKAMDDALDITPSCALNGLTPNEVKKTIKEENKISKKKEKEYFKQENACLSSKDALLFFKLYFALLDYTNKKYKIIPGLEINERTGLSPEYAYKVITKFWDNKNQIISQFCHLNPKKLKHQEIEIIKEFKKGIRDTFVIAKYEKEYTAIINKQIIYMIKGLNSNIDESVSYQSLPYLTELRILPFKNQIVYDGLIQDYNLKFGTGFYKLVEKEYQEALNIYYHL